jgi:hypothetical protein
MIGGWLNGMTTTFAALPGAVSPLKRVEPVEDDDPDGWDEPVSKGGCRHVTDSLAGRSPWGTAILACKHSHRQGGLHGVIFRFQQLPGHAFEPAAPDAPRVAARRPRSAARRRTARRTLQSPHYYFGKGREFAPPISHSILALLLNIEWVFNFTADLAGTMMRLAFQEAKSQTLLS